MEPSDYKPLSQDAHNYVDGQLSSEAECRFEERMGRNFELASQVDSLRTALSLLDTVRDFPVPADFDKKVIGRCAETDLVERARLQIRPALSPFWQPIMHVAMGAVAAAIIVVVIGYPSNDTEQAERPTANLNLPAEQMASIATEEDLLPALSDQFTRFENLRRQVQYVKVDDPAMQRETIRIELELSEVQRRNYWLRKEISGLPDARRNSYIRFLDGLATAFTTIDNELVDAQNNQRAPRKSVLNTALAGVEVPDRLREECIYVLRRVGSGASDELGHSKIGTGVGDPQVRSYTRIREALYSHDYSTMFDAAIRYSSEFPKGKFRDAAQLYAVIALIRENKDDRAAEMYVKHFGKHEADMTLAQLELTAGLMEPSEYSRLKAAQRKLSE